MTYYVLIPIFIVVMLVMLSVALLAIESIVTYVEKEEPRENHHHPER